MGMMKKMFQALGVIKRLGHATSNGKAHLSNTAEKPEKKKLVTDGSTAGIILARLKRGEYLSAMQATRNGADGLCTTKLTSRISDLRKSGYRIGDYWERTNDGKRYKVYFYLGEK